ncbi:MAG: hypothetical protein O3A29_20775 [Planctomycetota bacterium]|nr:hypothetical protein [Planctomycetota bacterium]
MKDPRSIGGEVGDQAPFDQVDDISRLTQLDRVAAGGGLAKFLPIRYLRWGDAFFGESSSVNRIISSLAVIGNVLMGVSFVLGMMIGDPRVRDLAVQSRVTWHELTALGSLTFALFVHAIVLTYFMGTSRWIEETSRAYRLSTSYHENSRSLKHTTYPGMMGCLVLLVITAGFGGAADPASAVGFEGWFGLSAGTIHLLVASVAFAANLIVTFLEYSAIHRNGRVIAQVIDEVNRIRGEKGLALVGERMDR